MEVLIFEHRTADVVTFLEKLLACRDLPPLISSFLDGATASLRTDISNLPRLQRDRIPPLNDLREWLAIHKNSSRRSSAIECALLTICQLTQWFE
jgi:hypothetical protein